MNGFEIGWKRECDDADEVLRHIGLDPAQCRTDGGWLNVRRIKTLLAERASPPVVQPEAVPHSAAAAQPIRDREADRARFLDPAFNQWLDEGISDAGHTVWDQVGSVVDAWHGWENRAHAATPPAAPEPPAAEMQTLREDEIRASERERICAAIKAADDKASEGDYMLDSDDCIAVVRGTWNSGAHNA